MAFPAPLPPPGPPTCFPFLFPLQTLLDYYCPTMTVNRNLKKEHLYCPESIYGTKLKMRNHTVFFPITMEVIDDSSRGENSCPSLLVRQKCENTPKNHRIICLML